MFNSRNTVTGDALINTWGTDPYGLSYVAFKYNLTVLYPPQKPRFSFFRKPKYLQVETETLVDLITNRPHDLLTLLFYWPEIIKVDRSDIPKKRTNVPVSSNIRYKLSTTKDQSKNRTEPTTSKQPKISDEPLVEIVEEHDDDIKGSPNVFSLIGKCWFVKYKQKEWGLYPDQEKYKYIVHTLNLTNDRSYRKNNLQYEFSIYNTELVSKVKGKDISEEYGDSSIERDLEHSDLADKLSKDELEMFKETGYKLLEEIKYAIKRKSATNIAQAEDQLTKYKSHLLNEYGIKVSVSTDKDSLYFKVLHRTSNEGEKTRQLVKNNTRNAIKDFQKPMPMLCRHLRNSISTKLSSSEYHPEVHTDWHISL